MSTANTFWCSVCFHMWVLSWTNMIVFLITFSINTWIFKSQVQSETKFYFFVQIKTYSSRQSDSGFYFFWSASFPSALPFLHSHKSILTLVTLGLRGERIFGRKASPLLVLLYYRLDKSLYVNFYFMDLFIFLVRRGSILNCSSPMWAIDWLLIISFISGF